MLKCASEHNLAPAQLEKLAQVYNTAKTLVGLEKQANRGDSFSIVDVPNLVANYVTYSPEQKVTGKSRSVHRKVDRLMKEASDLDGWGACVSQQLSKAASADGEQGEHRLPNLAGIMQEAINNNAGGWNYIDADTQSEFVEVDPGAAHYDVLHKSASVGRNARETKLYHEVTDQLRLAQEQYEQVAYETGEAILEKCAELRQKFTPDEGRWAEAVEDIFDAYGEKSIPAIRQVEAHFDATSLHIGPYDLTKRAFVRPLVQDRHDVFPVIEEIMALQELHKQAALLLPPPDKTKSSKKSKVPKDHESSKSEEKPTVEVEVTKTTVDPDEADEVSPEFPEGDPAAGMDLLPVPDGNPNPSGVLVLPESTAESAIEVLPREAVISTKELLEGMKEPFFKVKADMDTPVKKLEKVVSQISEGKNKRQKTIDEAVEEAERDTTLQQLMLSDPIVREADPSTVRDIFETISAISPSFARDPRKMSLVLKESLQYDSVPLHILKELGEYEEKAMKAEQMRSELNKSKYRLSEL